MDFLDRYRVDIDEAVGAKAVSIWKQIEGDLNGNGPFAQMLLAFRGDAVQAIHDLIHCDPRDAVRIAALQADIVRAYRTMERIDEFRETADAALANADNHQSDEETVVTIPEDEE